MRHSIRLFNHYKSFKRFFEENGLQILQSDIDFYFAEFQSPKSHRQYDIDSEKFFDYLINRLHCLGVLYQYDYNIPLEYKGYKAIYSYDPNLALLVGFVENEFDSSISGKTISDIEKDFQNTVDYVLLKR